MLELLPSIPRTRPGSRAGILRGATLCPRALAVLSGTFCAWLQTPVTLSLPTEWPHVPSVTHCSRDRAVMGLGLGHCPTLPAKVTPGPTEGSTRGIWAQPRLNPAWEGDRTRHRHSGCTDPICAAEAAPEGTAPKPHCHTQNPEPPLWGTKG